MRKVLQSSYVVVGGLVGNHLCNVVSSSPTTLIILHQCISCLCFPERFHTFSGRDILILEQGVVVKRNGWAPTTRRSLFIYSYPPYTTTSGTAQRVNELMPMTKAVSPGLLVSKCEGGIVVPRPL